MTPAHFIIAGAQRSGTTLLYRLLDQHPDVEMSTPVRPEPKYFLRGDASLDAQHYRKTLFPHHRDAHFLGEKSTSYMERSDVAANILATLPDVKIIFLLRDPVERAISNYKFSVENDAETAPIEDALAAEDERREDYDRAKFSASPYAYLARGHYHRFLEQWEAAVGRERIFVMLFEELVRDAATMQPLFQWLGAAPFDCVMSEEPVNASSTTVEVPTQLRRELAEHFRASNELLEQRYGLDVSSWTK